MRVILAKTDLGLNSECFPKEKSIFWPLVAKKQDQKENEQRIGMPEGEVWRSQELTYWCFVNSTVC